ncbi:hypothetical protein F2Q70_00045438 [Brassica cretica]|nr:hypothetical protein F2Q70_00045438 [Brassica cretica]
MEIGSNPTKLLPLLIITTMFIFFLCCCHAMVADEDDIRCLRGTQTFITDPQGVLKSWNFANITLGHKLAQVSLSQKPLVKVRHGDLMAAPNGFSSENIIFYTRTWTTYKALLLDGSALAVKHL